MIRTIFFLAAFISAVAIPADSVPVPSSPFRLDQLSFALPQLPMQADTSSNSLPASPFHTEIVKRDDLVATVSAAGTVNALVVVDVGSQLSGRVRELYVDFNSKVEEGQVIARVEPEVYEARVAQAEAELEMAQTQVSVQRAQIERVRAELETARAKHDSTVAQTTRAEVALNGAAQEMERKRVLAERKVIAAGEWERDHTAYKSAEAQVLAARADEQSQEAYVRAARAALGMAEAHLANTLAQVRQKEAVLRQAQIDLDRTYIRAPVTGTVINRAVSGGQTLAAGLQTPVLFTIAQDLTRMQVEASVAEADISRFAVGQRVTFTVDAYPERLFEGAVSQIRKAPQFVQNVVTYVAVIATDNPEELLLPGMTANLQVTVATRTDVLTVPNAALRFRPKDEDEASAAAAMSSGSDSNSSPGHPGRVFVPGPGGEPKAVHVRLGTTDGRVTEVLAGELQEGAEVMTGLAVPAGDNDDSSVLIRFRIR